MVRVLQSKAQENSRRLEAKERARSRRNGIAQMKSELGTRSALVSEQRRQEALYQRVNRSKNEVDIETSGIKADWIRAVENTTGNELKLRRSKFTHC